MKKQLKDRPYKRSAMQVFVYMQVREIAYSFFEGAFWNDLNIFLPY